jgi:hypothetical protein
VRTKKTKPVQPGFDCTKTKMLLFACGNNGPGKTQELGVCVKPGVHLPQL